MQNDAARRNTLGDAAVSVFYKSEALVKYALMGVLWASVFGLISFICWQYPLKSEGSYIGHFGCPLAALLSLAYSYVAIRRLINRQAVLLIDPSGITERQLIGVTRHVEWDEIGSFTVREEPLFGNRANIFLNIYAKGRTPEELLSIHVSPLFDIPLEQIKSSIEAYAATVSQQRRAEYEETNRTAQAGANHKPVAQGSHTVRVLDHRYERGRPLFGIVGLEMDSLGCAVIPIAIFGTVAVIASVAFR